MEECDGDELLNRSCEVVYGPGWVHMHLWSFLCRKSLLLSTRVLLSH